MSTTDVGVPCPSCGTGTTSRFCGHCGALVRPREGTAPTDAREEPARPAAVGVGSSRWLVPALAVALAVVVVASLVSRPTVEELTFEAGPSSLGAGGTGVTSNVAVTDLTRRWQLTRSDQGSMTGLWIEHLHAAGDEVRVAVDGELLALDRATGDVAWRVPGVLGVSRDATAALTLLAGAELATLDPRTGELSDRVTLAESVQYEQLGVPVGHDLVVAAAPLAGFDRGTGEVRWRAQDGWLAAVEGHLGVVAGDQVRVVDLRDGETLWSVPTSPASWQDAAILDASLVVADDRLTAYDLATGEQRWQVDDVPPRGQRRTFTVSGGLVLTLVAAVPDASGGPVGWQARDGAGRPVPVPEGIASVDAIAHEDGRWFGTAGGDLLAVGEDADGSAGELWRRDARAHVVAAGGGLVVAGTEGGLEVLDAATGALLTALPGRRSQAGPTHTVLGDCVVSHYPRLDAVRLADGEPCWSTRPELPGPPRGAHAGEGVVVVRSDRAITAVDADGSVVWQNDLGERVRSEHLPVTPRWHALVDIDRFLGGGPPEGRPDTGPPVELIDTRTGRTVPGPAFAGVPWAAVGRAGDDGAGVVAVQVQVLEPGGERFELQLWDLPDDDRTEPEHRWSVPTSADARPVLTADAVIVSTSTMLTEHDLRDGAVRRRVPLDVRIGPDRALGDDVLVAVSGGRLVGLDRGDGSRRWSLDLPVRLVAAPTIAGEVVYVAAAPRLVLLVRLGDGEVLGRLDLDEDITGPPAAGGRRLLVPTRRALVAVGPELPPPATG